MSAKRNTRGSLSGWEHEFREVWNDLPSRSRAELTKLLDQLPGGLKGWRDLLEQATRQVSFASGRKHKLAIIGPANAGKSTLYNALIQPSEPQAEVSPLPGTTRRIQEGDAGLFTLIDTPGTDAVGELGQEERAGALAAAERADLLVLLFDASHGIRDPERELFRDIAALELPTVLVLNKMDLAGRERAAVIGQAAAALGLQSGELIPISALKEQGLDQLLRAIVELEPQLIAALGAALPAYRWRLAQVVIGRAASAAAAVGLTPLPFLDFIPLIGLQVSMVLAIARIYKYRITLARARELLAALGVGALGRTLFYELSKVGGPPTWLLAAGVAAGTTAALGYGSAHWFERGERLTADRLRAVSRAFTGAIVERLKSLGRRKPGRATLREQMQQALEDLPAPGDQDVGAPGDTTDPTEMKTPLEEPGREGRS